MKIFRRMMSPWERYHARRVFASLQYDEAVSSFRSTGHSDEWIERWWTATIAGLRHAGLGVLGVPKFDELDSRLRRIGLSQADAARWWFQALPALAGKRPLDVADSGEWDKIARVIDGMETTR